MDYEKRFNRTLRLTLAKPMTVQIRVNGACGFRVGFKRWFDFLSFESERLFQCLYLCGVLSKVPLSLPSLNPCGKVQVWSAGCSVEPNQGFS
jgi:hypothetical protein